MFCTNCGNAFEEQDNFCRRCGAKRATAPAGSPQETVGSRFLKRLGYAIALQLQQQAIANAMHRQASGDNFWGSATACGNHNGSSGYVDVGGTIVGYDR